MLGITSTFSEKAFTSTVWDQLPFKQLCILAMVHQYISDPGLVLNNKKYKNETFDAYMEP